MDANVMVALNYIRVHSRTFAVLILLLFWTLLIAIGWNQSVTADELVHAPAGYSYWKYNDYRIDPENGNLPQRIAGLPLLGLPFPPTTSENWQVPYQWLLGEEWFHTLGIDVPGLLRRGRSAAALQAVALAALVWGISRRLFGPAGGLLSLLLCVLNPTLLANGSLMTSDTAAALFFLAATWMWWLLLQRITPLRLIGSALATAGLFASKSSAALILPIFLTLAVIRLLDRQPLAVRFPGFQRELRTRTRRGAALVAAAALQALVCYAAIWGIYGFRYSAFAPGQPNAAGSSALWYGVLRESSVADIVEAMDLPRAARNRAREVFVERSVPLYGWARESDNALEQLQEEGHLSAGQIATIQQRRTEDYSGGMTRTIRFLARHKLLPEAYLVGSLHAWRFAQVRGAFLDGDYYLVGKPYFFPYTFAVKTPLAFIALLAIAGIAWHRLRRDRAGAAWAERVGYHLIPLVVLFAFYGAAMLTSRLNIGHRHMLTMYPPMFIFAGAAGTWLTAAGRRKAGPYKTNNEQTSRLSSHVSRLTFVVPLLLAAQAAEIAWRFPHYIAYFNGVISPSMGYRHFIDSTLDWGQDLPAAKVYIDAHPEGKPYLLSFFGNGNPRTYGIEAQFLPSTPGRFRKDLDPVIFHPVAASPGPAEIDALKQRYPGHDYIGVGNLDGAQFAIFFRPARAWGLPSGTYLVSASMVQAKYAAHEEFVYQQLRQASAPYFSSISAEQSEAMRRFNMRQWRDLLNGYDGLRQKRLNAFLRAYKPDDQIGYSINVYKLTEADIARALEGPSPVGVEYTGRTVSGR